MSTYRNCEDFELLLIEKEERVLAPEEDLALGGHLDRCPACTGFARELAPLEAAMRRELAPADPGDAFFIRTRNEVYEVLRAATKAVPEKAEPRPSLAARVAQWLFGGHRGLASAAVGFAAAALVGVLLWPRPELPPSHESHRPIQQIAPASVGAPPNGDANGMGDVDVLPEISTLSNEELKTLSSRLVIETSADTDLEEDAEGVEGQLDGMSGEELKALDNQLTLAAKEPKGA